MPIKTRLMRSSGGEAFCSLSTAQTCAASPVRLPQGTLAIGAWAVVTGTLIALWAVTAVIGIGTWLVVAAGGDPLDLGRDPPAGTAGNSCGSCSVFSVSYIWGGSRWRCGSSSIRMYPGSLLGWIDPLST